MPITRISGNCVTTRTDSGNLVWRPAHLSRPFIRPTTARADVSLLVSKDRRVHVVLSVAAHSRDAQRGGNPDHRRCRRTQSSRTTDLPFARRLRSQRSSRVGNHIAQISEGYGNRMSPAPPTIVWGASTPLERGPVVAGTNAGSARNAIGVHAAGFAIYQGLAAATGALSAGHRPNLQDTGPSIDIGPFPQWT